MAGRLTLEVRSACCMAEFRTLPLGDLRSEHLECMDCKRLYVRCGTFFLPCEVEKEHRAMSGDKYPAPRVVQEYLSQKRRERLRSKRRRRRVKSKPTKRGSR